MNNDFSRATLDQSTAMQAPVRSGNQHFLDWLRAPPAPSERNADRHFIDFLSEDRNFGRSGDGASI